MTQKELLYMEDAVGHTNNLTTLFTNFAKDLEDQDLKNCLEKLAKKQQSLGNKLLNVMEDIENAR